MWRALRSCARVGPPVTHAAPAGLAGRGVRLGRLAFPFSALASRGVCGHGGSGGSGGGGGRRTNGGGGGDGASGSSGARARTAATFSLLAATSFSTIALADGSVQPPVAPRRPHVVKIGAVAGEERGASAFDPPIEMVDELFWLRDDKRESAEVLAHLRAENAYSAAATAHLEAFREALYAELLSHVKETDDSAPYPHGPYEYYTRTVEGLSYVIHCRKPRGASGKSREQVLLDENEVATRHPDHCDVGAVEVSPSHTLLGWSVDGKGYETYTIRFAELATGRPLDDALENTTGEVVWGADERSVYYSTFDAAHRPCAVWRHVLGTPQAQDVKLFDEPDGLFYVSVGKTRDGRLLLVSADSTETSEVHLLELTDRRGKPLDGPLSAAPPPLAVVQPREHKLRYSVSHRHDWLYITTNEGEAHNEKVVVAPLATPGRAHWQPLATAKGEPVLPHCAERTISYATCFGEYVVVKGREAGLTQVWVLEMAGKGPRVRGWHRVEWPEAAYECGLGPNEEMDTRVLRLGFSSPVTPRRAVAYHMDSRRMSVVKETPVPNYDPSLYTSARRHIVVRDGTKVPVTLFWRKDLVRVEHAESGAPSAPAPLHLYGYGSYGHSIEPAFSSRTLPLVDRGMVFAIAHVRGGSENGRWQWYEEGGKYLTKRNTFNDFVDVGDALVTAGWTRPEAMSCEGRSAGGLLVGNAVNLAPHLFRAVIAGVPFVDLIVTMCDPSIPLTTGEWEEWGNPNEPKCGAPRAARLAPPTRARPLADRAPPPPHARRHARTGTTSTCSPTRPSTRCARGSTRASSRPAGCTTRASHTGSPRSGCNTCAPSGPTRRPTRAKCCSRWTSPPATSPRATVTSTCASWPSTTRGCSTSSASRASSRSAEHRPADARRPCVLGARARDAAGRSPAAAPRVLRVNARR